MLPKQVYYRYTTARCCTPNVHETGDIGKSGKGEPQKVIDKVTENASIFSKSHSNREEEAILNERKVLWEGILRNLRILVGLIPVLALVVFANQLIHTTDPQNITTWVMWIGLNLVIAASGFRAGNSDAWLPLGFAFGNGLVAITLLWKGETWGWGTTETVCTIGIVAAMTLWKISGPILALIASVVAIWIASVPLIMFTAANPNPVYWYVWATPAVCGIILFFAAEEWTWQHRLFPASTFIFTTLMLSLSMGWWS